MGRSLDCHLLRVTIKLAVVLRFLVRILYIGNPISAAAVAVA